MLDVTDAGSCRAPSVGKLGAVTRMNRSEGLDHEAVVERSELARHLRGSIFPADRDTVVECAIQEHASPHTLGALRRLPNAVYENVEQVWEALGGEREAR
jgi:hypothetical protein